MDEQNQDTQNNLGQQTTPQIDPANSYDMNVQLPTKQPKLPPITNLIIGSVVILFGIGVGVYLVFGGKEPKTNDSTINNQESTAEISTSQDTKIEKNTESMPNQLEMDNLQIQSVKKLNVAVVEYSSNNNGDLPTISKVYSDVIPEYLGGIFNSPNTGEPYKIVETEPLSGEIQYKIASNCADDNSILGGSKRQLALRVLLSSNSYYCLSN